jgi:hypothetical protein
MRAEKEMEKQKTRKVKDKKRDDKQKRRIEEKMRAIQALKTAYSRW